MSTYQYYEFQAIDRPLSTQEQQVMQSLSSRAQVTPHQASFVYHYGDFRGRPEELVAQYFDAMLYMATWGTRHLILRFPKPLVDPAWFSPYTVEDVIEVSTTAQHLILHITLDQELGGGWLEGEGWLPQLLPLRAEVMNGDLRLLYLAWLQGVANLAHDEDSDSDGAHACEPPVPPNLGNLSDALSAFVEWVELDVDLVNAAAQASPQPAQPRDIPPLEDLIPQLSATEQREFLVKLVHREPHVDLQLINRLKELAGGHPMTISAAPGRRTYPTLMAMAHDLKAQRTQSAAAAAHQERLQYLEDLARREAQTWDRVMDLIQVKQAYAYDEATRLLKDLRDLAQHQGRKDEFVRRLNRLKETYSNRPALQRRFKAIKI